VKKKQNKFVIFFKTQILIILKKIEELFFTIIDLIYIFLVSLNIKNNKLSKNRKVTIVTAADSSHYRSSRQLIKSVLSTNKDVDIYFYDLEIDAKFDFNEFQDESFIYNKFPFEQYPKFFSKKYFSEYDNGYKLGYYAWKGVITSKVAEEVDGILIWCDAGNILKKELNLIRKIVTKKKFFSPISSNRVKDWTHSSLVKNLRLTNKILIKRNLWSCFVCFDLSTDLGKKMVKLWSDWSLKEEYIAPQGSNRFNHRQDQTLITLIYHQEIKKLLIPKTYKIFGLRFQQDLEIK